MTNRELLEAAAKAAGVTILRSRLDDPMWHDMLIDLRPAFPQTAGWNPLIDDGDALRLAVKLQMIVDFSQDDGPLDVLPVIARGCVHDKADPYAATRRSIVMCAAAMGEKA